MSLDPPHRVKPQLGVYPTPFDRQLTVDDTYGELLQELVAITAAAAPVASVVVTDASRKKKHQESLIDGQPHHSVCIAKHQCNIPLAELLMTTAYVVGGSCRCNQR